MGGLVQRDRTGVVDDILGQGHVSVNGHGINVEHGGYDRTVFLVPRHHIDMCSDVGVLGVLPTCSSGKWAANYFVVDTAGGERDSIMPAIIVGVFDYFSVQIHVSLLGPRPSQFIESSQAGGRVPVPDR